MTRRRKTTPSVTHVVTKDPVSSLMSSLPPYLALAGTLGALAAFYFNTNYAITDLKSHAEGDVKVREQLRDALTKNAEKTSEAIAELTKHAAVQDERTQNLQSTLSSIQGQLGSIATAISPIKREQQGK